jgi:hypothetical protein
MSNNLAHPATLNYSGHFSFRSPREVIRSSSLRGTNIVYPCYPCSSSRSQSEGRVEPQLNGFVGKPQLNGSEGGFVGAARFTAWLADTHKSAEYSKSSKHSKGKPDLNYFFPSQCDHIRWSLECKSNRAGLPLNQVKIPLQYQELPPLNPATNKIIDLQKILTGFGGGAEGGGGLEAFEPDSFSQTRWSSGSKMPGALLGTVLKEHSNLIRSGCALP